MATDITAVARQFVDFYYSTFDRNRNDLRPLYKDVSMLSFEGTHFQGVNAIVDKLVSLPFQTVQHRVVTVDAQPSNPQINSILVSVTGQLVVDGSEQPMQYCQTFQLIPEGNTFFVYNDMFRLNYG